MVTSAASKSHECQVGAFLRSPELFDGVVPTVVETHISWVFIGGSRVLKLKKILKFEFLDYSTLEAREKACRDEVKFNRRLAPEVYLGALPILKATSGALSLASMPSEHTNAGAEVVDWVVDMRRLPESRMLDHLICAGQATEQDAKSLADILAPFYANARRVSLPLGTMAARVTNHVQGNYLELARSDHELPPAIVHRIHGRQLQFVALNRSLFDQRVEAGMIVDGHGDLRPEHVCMLEPPVVFDCIEFNDELREIDVADELGFFAVECESLGAGALGKALLRYCEQTLGDAAPEGLISFYESYRAGVRAKVAALKSSQRPAASEHGPDPAALKYLRLADRSLGWAGSPICILMRGVSGSGKSTIASVLSKALGAAHLQTDEVRQEISEAASVNPTYGEGRYGLEGRLAVYERLAQKARSILREGRSVIVDGAFLSRKSMSIVVAALDGSGVDTLAIHCSCRDEIAMQRIKGRSDKSLSEARPEFVASQRAEFESVPSSLPSVTLDTGFEPCPSDVPAVVLDGIRQLLQRDPQPGARPSPSMMDLKAERQSFKRNQGQGDIYASNEP